MSIKPARPGGLADMNAQNISAFITNMGIAPVLIFPPGHSEQGKPGEKFFN